MCTLSNTPPQSASSPYRFCAPCLFTLSISTSRHVRHVLRRPLFALIIAPSRVGIWTPSNTWFLGPTEVHIPNGNSVGSAVFAGLTVVTDRPTDRPRYSVCSYRLHLAIAAMRLKIVQHLALLRDICKKLISLKHCVRSQITRLKQQKSFCDLQHGASLSIQYY